jgi:hypothetical protein
MRRAVAGEEREDELSDFMFKIDMTPTWIAVDCKDHIERPRVTPRKKKAPAPHRNYQAEYNRLRREKRKGKVNR